MYRSSPEKKRTQMMSAGIAIGILIFAVTCAAQTLGGKQLPLEAENKKAYKIQAEFIRSEIQSLRSNLEWLELKIKDMKDMKRQVPYRLVESVTNKKNKIASLTSVLKRYEKLARAKSDQTKSPRPLTADPTKNTYSASNGLTAMREELKSVGLGDWMQVVKNNTGVIIENSLPVLFSSGSAKLAPGYDSFLKRLSMFLKGKDVRIAIRGYADVDPIRTEKYPSNFELGAARAGVVVRKMTSYGLKPSIFKVVTTGEHRVDNAHKATKWKNLQRHVNILISFMPGNISGKK